MSCSGLNTKIRMHFFPVIIINVVISSNVVIIINVHIFQFSCVICKNLNVNEKFTNLSYKRSMNVFIWQLGAYNVIKSNVLNKEQ